MDEMGWMRHSLLLAEDMVGFARAYLRREDVDWILYEVQAMRLVIKAVRADKVQVLPAGGLVWWEYMQDHARLEIAKEARVIDADTFYRESARLLKVRRLKLAAISGDMVA